MSDSKLDHSVEIEMGVFVDASLLKEFPEEVAREFQVVPLRQLGKGLLVGAVQEPSKTLLKKLSNRLNKPICAIPCRLSDIARVFQRLYDSDNDAKKIGQILTEERVLSDEELDEALEEQKKQEKARPLGQILLDLGLVSREELSMGLAGQEEQNNPSLSPALFVDPKLIEKIPESLAKEHQVLALTMNEDTLVVACDRPLDSDIRAELESVTGYSIEGIPAKPEELSKALEKSYGRYQKARNKELRLGELLTSEGLLDEKQLQACLDEQQETGQKLGEIVVEKGFVSEDTVFKTLAAKLNVAYRRFATSEIDLEVGKMISKRFAKQNQVLVLGVDEDAQEMEVAMADPADLNLKDILQGIASQHGYRVKPVLAAPSNIQSGISYAYQSRGLVDDSSVDMETVREDKDQKDDLNNLEHMPEIKRIVNQLLYSGVSEGASDIHIENLEHNVEVRFRIDGVLEERDTPINKDNIAKVISVLKVDAGLDIAEKRRSQDGKFKKRIGSDRFIDFRINVHATTFGEDAVIRILDRQKNLMSLEKLGFDKSTLENYRRLIDNPQGLILFTGPTGSGKTTTLYSTLTYLNEGNRKIVTAEDPIEYILKGISQYQVNEAIGNTFDDYARRFLRKDPDIILIGEIRDKETAKACVDAAMTGHLVFSTLHTNDAVGVVRRLENLGVAPSSISDSLLLVVSQRLARRTCSQCAEPYEMDPSTLSDFFPRGAPSDFKARRGIGCEACRLKGYRGRVGLYEFWEVDKKARKKISAGATEDEIRETALEEGMRVLLEDALLKVRKGITTLEELGRVISIDQRQKYAELLADKELEELD